MDQVGGAGLDVAAGVAEREHDGPGREVQHGLHALLPEQAGHAREAQQRGGAGVHDHVVHAGVLAVEHPAAQVFRAAREAQLLVFQVRLAVHQQAVAVHDEHAGVRVLGAQPVGLKAVADGHGHADPGGPRAHHHEHLFAQAFALEARGADQPGQRHGARALNVVVEAGHHAAVAFQHPERRAPAEILPLDDRFRVAGRDGLHEGIQELVVRLAGQAAVVHAQVQRIVDQVLTVGADVQLDRQGLVRPDAPGGRVQRQFPDADRHAPEALIPDAQDGAAVGGDDHAHVVHGDVLQHVLHAVDVARADREPARVAVVAGVVAHGLADCGRVDDGQHLLKVVFEDRVEQHLVAVLEGTQVLVFFQVGAALEVAQVRAFLLLLEGAGVRRHEALEAQFPAFLGREGGGLVQQRILQQRQSRHVHVDEALSLRVAFHVVVPGDRKIFRHDAPA